MSQEGLKPLENKLFATLSVMGGVFLLYEIANLSFSGPTRDKIIARANNRSEVSGLEPPEGESLHACHKNHDKSRPNYDNPDNGFAATKKEHYLFHRVHRGRARDIGLSEQDNESAIELLYSLLTRRKK